ncbi:hypothetical protein pEaSNUABM35_00322 [Erwinia phage pEa_SNUABM_35]|uniref:Uncharacterized protein n=1 Tax=Erwinia phage pEa_SNUABM_35 TaxID=2869557 RepID=A0AAE7XPI4_9CAUD|nr:hypothetical protein MPK65_gp322 [Erwinia phage pEa_SNUABM_35]QZE60239.1 hypothetical protein pEaSNUABM35_00322 [Erwinia phage pEa_SNUABM_35]QZE60575.1 hypothetical protein pEaSNUABM36_00322 [Erwinia phage pEa_SNUABM_36]
MSENNLGAAATFGSETQKQLNDQQRRAHSAESGHVNKCTIVVLTALNAHGRFSYLTADEQLRERSIEGKVMDRLPDLIGRASGPSTDPNSAYHILHPNNGVPTRIDERIKVGEADSVIISYTVNKAVSEMYGSLSLALFSAGESDIADLAAEYGIHSISIVEEAKAPDYIKALTEQVEALNIVNLTSIDEADGAFEKPVINYSALPGNPINVLSGAVRTFIMQTLNGEVFAAIPNNGELNVKQPTNATPVNLDEDFDSEDEVVDQQGGESDDEEVTGTDLFGYKAETLTVAQMTEALEALSYDVSAMDEAGIRESFETEQQIWMEGNDAAEEDGEEEDAEDEEESDDEDSEFDPSLYLGHLLSADQLDRSALKVLVRTQDLKVMKSDTEETLTAKLLELVEGATEQEMAELIDTFVGALQEREIDCPNLLAALSSDEDEEEDAEESEEEDEEESEDEESEDEDDSDSVQDQIDAVTDPLDYFQFAGGSLTAEQRVAAVEAMGEDVTGLNIVQVMKAFSRIQGQTNEIDVDAEESESNVAELEALLGQYDDATVQHVAESLGVNVDECETAEDMIEAIVNGGTEDQFAAVEEIATSYGVDLSEVADGEDLDFVDAVLSVLPSFLSDDEQEEDEEDEESEEEESEDGEEEDEDEQDSEIDSSENESLKFIKSVNSDNAVGTLLAVDMDQTVVINFTLTDGDTYSAVESELVDINGFNYRFPFNLGKASKGTAPGSMLLPAQSLLDIVERVNTTRFLADPKTFDIGAWAESLEATLAEEIPVALYADRIEDGVDPSEAGLVVGDFLDEEELEAATELGHIDADDASELNGDHLPLASLYNARSRVRPVRVDSAYVALHTTVMNVALPGFWSEAPVQRMIQAAVNRVINLAESVENVKVYAAFTMESAALLNNGRLFEALATLREFEHVQSYSAADAANFDDAEDVIEVAGSLDTRDLPLSVLAGGLAGASFDNGGDLTILVPCFTQEEDADEEEGDDGDDE